MHHTAAEYLYPTRFFTDITATDETSDIHSALGSVKENKNGYRVQSYISGYLGYMKNSGDKPIVFRIHAEKKLKRSSLILGFQQGLNDFKYSSVEMGMKYNFKCN